MSGVEKVRNTKQGLRYLLYQESLLEAEKVIDKILNGEPQNSHKIKNDRQTLLTTFCMESNKVFVYKEPRQRNKKTWHRLRSIFKESTSFELFRSHCKLLELGLVCPKPIAAVEKRILGMVFYSSFVPPMSG